MRDPEKAKARHKKWRKLNRKKLKALYDEYRKANPEKRKAIMDAWRERNPEKVFAISVVNNAVAAGKLVKPPVCEQCGTEGRVEGHHEDYLKPLVVIWLCKRCHANRHYTP